MAGHGVILWATALRWVLTLLRSQDQLLLPGVTHRAEETSSPNVLEQDLKSVKCFRLAAKWPIEDVYMADATLVGCKKKMEAKPRLRLGLEPEVVQILYKNALSDDAMGNFVWVKQAAIYALMYYMTTRFEEVKGLELRQIGKKRGFHRTPCLQRQKEPD